MVASHELRRVHHGRSAHTRADDQGHHSVGPCDEIGVDNATDGRVEYDRFQQHGQAFNYPSAGKRMFNPGNTIVLGNVVSKDQ